MEKIEEVINEIENKKYSFHQQEVLQTDCDNYRLLKSLSACDRFYEKAYNFEGCPDRYNSLKVSCPAPCDEVSAYEEDMCRRCWLEALEII